MREDELEHEQHAGDAREDQEELLVGAEPAGSEAGSAPTPTPAPAPPVEPPPALAPRAADPNAEIAARTKDVLSRFVAWSREHQGAPCPEIAALGDPPRDPWGHAFRLTCTDQPGDQIVGAISSGPDGTPGTADDIASWQLGRNVTDIVRGARWVAAAAAATPALSTPARPEPGTKADVRREPAPPTGKTAERKPVAGPKPRQTKPGKGIEFDENGLPISR